MIVRTWVAYAKPGNARAYREHLKASVLPQLRNRDGFLGLSVCEAEQGDRVEILVISRWHRWIPSRRSPVPRSIALSSTPARGRC